MAIGRTLKFLFVVAAFLQAPTSTLAGAASRRKEFTLPPECADLEWVAGTAPVQAKTVIFGTLHGDTRCESIVAHCAQKLAEGTSTTRISALIEQVPRDLATTCLAESASLGVSKLTNKCSGWNVPSTQGGLSRLQFHIGYKVLQTLSELRKKIILSYSSISNPYASIPLDEMKAISLKKLKGAVYHYSLELKKAEALEETEFKNYQAEYPNAVKEKYFSSQTPTIIFCKHFINFAQKMSTQLESGVSVREVFQKATDEFNQYTMRVREDIGDLNKFFIKPNFYLLETIKEKAKSDKKIFAFPGRDHVSKNFRNPAPGQNKIAEDFHKELEKFADENPYAVLACKFR